MGEGLTKVAFARDAIEGAMIKGVLEGAGIPAFLQSSTTKVDGMELAFGMLARGSMGGPQDVMVRTEQADDATAVLAATPGEGDEYEDD